jgi:hypothetical protein
MLTVVISRRRLAAYVTAVAMLLGTTAYALTPTDPTPAVTGTPTPGGHR